MRELSENQVQQVAGGITSGTAIGIASLWAGTVAGVGLGLVGAPVLAAGAVGLAFGAALLAAGSLIDGGNTHPLQK